jgi:hypothetical protein
MIPTLERNFGNETKDLNCWQASPVLKAIIIVLHGFACRMLKMKIEALTNSSRGYDDGAREGGHLWVDWEK